MSPNRIRPLALGVPHRGGEVLVSRGHDPARESDFHRPLGGGIRFGERSDEAVARELAEEIGVTVTDAVLLDVCESVFEFGGDPGHELVFVYRVALAESWPYERDAFAGHEEGDGPIACEWVAVDELGTEVPAYPEGFDFTAVLDD